MPRNIALALLTLPSCLPDGSVSFGDLELPMPGFQMIEVHAGTPYLALPPDASHEAPPVPEPCLPRPCRPAPPPVPSLDDPPPLCQRTARLTGGPRGPARGSFAHFKETP